MSQPLPCTCCGRQVPNANPRQPLHFDCWDEHHSDPTGVWPPDHTCAFDETIAARYECDPEDVAEGQTEAAALEAEIASFGASSPSCDRP